MYRERERKRERERCIHTISMIIVCISIFTWLQQMSAYSAGTILQVITTLRDRDTVVQQVIT